MRPPECGVVEIASDALSVRVDPQAGGTIVSITHLGLGLGVLGQTPWDHVSLPMGELAARDEAHWLGRYGGGWPLLFPNGGDACVVEGTRHGFHGEASVAPWKASASRTSVELTRRFFTVPAEMRRELRVEGDLLVIREQLRMTGPRPLDVMWGHHPTFGSDLLAGSVEITSAARCVSADAAYDPPANPLLPGAAGRWPMLPGKTGPVDLSRPTAPLAAMAYLTEFEAPWVAIRRLDNAVAAALSWTAQRFPCAWLWYELSGTAEAPWFNRGQLIGIEPSTTWPASGLAKALRAGRPLLRLDPGEEYNAEIRLHVFRPHGRIVAVDGGGRAVSPDTTKSG